MQIQRRKGAKIHMKCNKCREDCDPRNGDWHESTAGQIFLCRECELSLKPVKAGPRAWSFEIRHSPA
jgi:hypothetical protein